MKSLQGFLVFYGFVLALSIGASTPAEAGRTVVFDQGHGQRFIIEHGGPLDLSGLASTFAGQGVEVKSNLKQLDGETLKGAAALVISGPFARLSETELAAVAAFLENGGRLCLMLHIAPPATELMNLLGVDATNGVLFESQNVIKDNPLDFQVLNLKSHPVTTGLKGFNVYGAWGVSGRAGKAETIASTTEAAWMDANHNRQKDEGEAGQAYGLTVAGTLGQGRFVVFGDDAIFQNQFLDSGNKPLAENVVRWLTEEVKKE